MWYICTMECYSAIRMNEIMPFAATWMQLEIIILSEGKSKRERQIPYDITYMWNLNMTQINLSMKQNHEHREQTGDCQGGRRWGRDGVGCWG